MNKLLGQTITNPVSGEKVRFIHTAAETNGTKSVIEIQLQGNADGPPPHFHRVYKEVFKVLEGEILVQLNKEEITLKAGEVVEIPEHAVHSFRANGAKPALIEVTLLPGHEGFENAIAILFGLAEDGKVNRKGIPKSLQHIAIIHQLSDSHFTGLLSLIAKLINLRSNSSSFQRSTQELMKKYCGVEAVELEEKLSV